MSVADWLGEHRYVLLVFLFFILATVFRANIDGIFLTHPGTVKAADGFYHVHAAQVIVDTEHYGYLPWYIALGEKKMIDPNPPFLYLWTAGITKLSGIPSWDVMYFLVSLLHASLVLVAFIFARRVFKSDAVGVIASASLVLPLIVGRWLYGVYIGLWIMIAGFAFATVSLWLLYRCVYDPSRKNLLLAGIMTGATLLAHLPEAVLLFPFCAVLLIWLLFKKNILFAERIKRILIFSTPIIILLLLFLPMFLELTVFGHARGGTFGLFLNRDYTKGDFYTGLSTFPWWILILSASGLLLGAFTKFSNQKRWPVLIFYAWMFFYLLIFPYLTTVDYYVTRQRMLLPFFVLPLFAYAVVQLAINPFAELLSLLKQWNTIVKSIVKYAAVLLTSGIIIYAGYSAVYLPVPPTGNSDTDFSNSYAVGYGYSQIKSVYTSNQHITSERYEFLQWLEHNTPETAKITYVEGFYQFSSMFSKRIGFFVDIPDLPKYIQTWASSNGTIVPLAMRMDSHGSTEMAGWLVRDSLFSYHRLPMINYSIERNLGDFDFVVLNNLGNQNVEQFNRAVERELLNKGYSRIYNNYNFQVLKKGNTVFANDSAGTQNLNKGVAAK